MPRVLISDSLSDAAADIFRNRGIDVDVKTGLSPEELIEIIGQYDGLAVRSATKVKEPVLAAATARGVIVMNTPYGNAITTAEHAIAMMFALARDIPQADASTQASKWEKSRFMGVEVTGKTLGIIGCGNIGSIVADRALGLRMKVIAYDPYLSEERAQELGVEKVELEPLLKRADFVTLHVPKTEQTANLLNAERIALMKKGARLINCARGGLVVEADLKAALDSGHLAGAALDVFEVEPAKDNPLFGHPKLICTPHLGAATQEAQENVALQVAEQMSDYLMTGAVTNALNTPSVSAEDSAKLRPYMKLADQLGGFAGQITETGLKSVEILYSGPVADLNVKPLTAVLLRSLLAPMVETVNMVNAPVVAKERDIRVTESRSASTDLYATSILLTVTTEQRTRTVRGTLFGNGEPRIVEVEGVAVEAAIAPNMLFVRNEDKPGFIGNLGRTLGDAGINIASFDLGRTTAGGMAVALVATDGRVDDALLKKISELPSVLQAKVLSF